VKIINEIDKASEPWGVKVLRYEIRDIRPSAHVVDTLERRMEAEREKRSKITMASAEKERLINISEGERQSAINISQGEKTKKINEAEGNAESIKLIAGASAQSIILVGSAIKEPCGDEALTMRLVDQYIDQLGKVIESCDVSVFPAGLASIKGIFDEIRDTEQIEELGERR
jgi:regulator of protease activity HflC (stomatin/prohibitin superfamily)